MIQWKTVIKHTNVCGNHIEVVSIGKDYGHERRNTHQTQNFAV